MPYGQCCYGCKHSGRDVRPGYSITGRRIPLCPMCTWAAHVTRLLVAWRSPATMLPHLEPRQ